MNSCQNENELQIQSKKKELNEITKENAIEIAKKLVLNDDKTSKFGKGSATKKISSIFPMTTKKSETAFYVVNYQNGGFVIISADNRNIPILAYSDSASFQNDSINYPSGLRDWLSLQKEVASNISTENREQTSSIKEQWNSVSRIAPEDPVCPNDQTITVGPLLTTTWGQGDGYNDYTPLTGCTNYYNGHAPTGCVATAMAQVMKYYQKPNTYNWSNMPNGYGTYDTAILMRDIGSAVRMDYGCGGSGANSEEEIASTFRDDFHYSNAAGGNYNYQVVCQQLAAGRPVILTGGRKKNDISWTMYTDGHAWVCDGYKSSSYYNYDPSVGCSGVTYLQLHMNWGWGTYNNYNGWYFFDNFNPSNKTYNYQVKMYYNIIP